jgi:hypothetical protein
MKCFVLALNDMRSSNIENTMIACRANTKEALEKLIQQEAVPGGWRDGQWGKAASLNGSIRLILILDKEFTNWIPTK